MTIFILVLTCSSVSMHVSGISPCVQVSSYKDTHHIKLEATLMT